MLFLLIFFIFKILIFFILYFLQTKVLDSANMLSYNKRKYCKLFINTYYYV